MKMFSFITTYRDEKICKCEYNKPVYSVPVYTVLISFSLSPIYVFVTYFTSPDKIDICARLVKTTAYTYVQCKDFCVICIVKVLNS